MNILKSLKNQTQSQQCIKRNKIYDCSHTFSERKKQNDLKMKSDDDVANEARERERGARRRTS